MTMPRIWTLLAGLSLVSTIACSEKDDDDDEDGDGFNDTVDCDDDDAAAYPGAEEICDGIDNDCDGEIDNDPVDGLAAWVDADGDGYGDVREDVMLCELVEGYAENDDDCDDADPDSFPGNPEFCDGADNDCNGTADDEPTDGTTYYLDSDGDGYGDAADSVLACEQASDRVEDATDCDDGDGDVYPGADEICDGIDNDCDTETDESGAIGEQTWYIDSDGDGFGDSNDPGTLACDAPSGTVSVGGDCNDAAVGVNPDAAEVCDGEDTDCDSSTSEDGMVDFTDAAGTSTDVTATFSGGTASSPAAVTLSDEGTYTFCDGTYYVDLEIEADVTLTSQSGGAALDGGDSVSIINMEVDGLSVGISDLTLQNGNGDGTLPESSTTASGGGINCSSDPAVLNSTVTIEGVTFDSNNSNELGGAIASYGCDFEITDSVLTGNSSSIYAGAALVTYGDLSLENSDVSDNTAPVVPGVYHVAGQADFTDTLFDGNSATSSAASALAAFQSDVTCTGSSSSISGFTSNSASSSQGAAAYLGDGSTFTATDCDFGTDPATDANSPNDIWIDDADLPFKIMADDATFSCDSNGCGTQTTIETGTGAENSYGSAWVYRGNPFTITGTPTIETVGYYLDIPSSTCTVRFHIHEWDGSAWTVLWSGVTYASAGQDFVTSPTVGLAFEDGDEVLIGFSKNCSGTDYFRSNASVGSSFGFGDYDGGYWYASNTTMGYSFVPSNSTSTDGIYDLEVTYWEE